MNMQGRNDDDNELKVDETNKMPKQSDVIP